MSPGITGEAFVEANGMLRRAQDQHDKIRGILVEAGKKKDELLKQ